MGRRFRKAFPILLAFGTALVFGQAPVKKVTRIEAMNAAISKTQPEYPGMARQLKIEGTVELQLIVAENGTVEDVNVVSGNPILTKPAAEAARKWKFTPFLQDGKPVKAEAPVTIVFKKQ